MSNPNAFTGERYVPGVVGEIAYEHCHRYAFARRFARGRRVLDAACGEGYGVALLADASASVIGIDIDAGVIAAAAKRYGDLRNVRFASASVVELPLSDRSVDVVVSFETIEHIGATDQTRMLAEFARVLAPTGLLVLSSPNRPEYSDARDYVNPFHVHELDRDELSRLLDAEFPARLWFRQRRYLGSAIWSEQQNAQCETLSGDAASVAPAVQPDAMYFVVVAARAPEWLPTESPALSLYADRDGAELKRIDHEASEVLRLDALLGARDRALERCAAAIEELTGMVSYRDQVITGATAEKEAARAALDAARMSFAGERAQLLREIADHMRRLAYRESARGWLRLPLMRLRRWWRTG